MIRRPQFGGAWQVILADLSLILFITVLAGMVAARNDPDHKQRDVASEPVQAIYRKTSGGVSLSQWLDLETRDPRAQLTIHASYSPGEEAVVLRESLSLWREAFEAGREARLIVESGEETTIIATFAYDKNQAGK